MPSRAHVFALYVLGVVSASDVDRPSSFLQAASRRELVNEFDIVSLLLHNGTRLHFSEVQDRLVPILSALPAERPGYVCYRVARYALVRYFLVYRGWHIKGLSREAGVWNAFPADAVYKSRFPWMLLRFITTILHKTFIGMKDLAKVVAAVETLVYSNVKDILMLAYGALALSIEEPLRDLDQEQLVMKTFTTLLMDPGSQTDIAEKPVESVLQRLREDDAMASFWVEIDMWVSDTSQASKRVVANPFPKGRDFASMLAMADVVSSDIVRFYNSDCLSMKHRLMDAGGTGNGRISLADFYRPELGDDHWVFRESPKYLEATGVLDVSTLRHDSVLISNYVTTPSNCLDSSTFHQMCCINECELLLMHVEVAAGKPDARPIALLEAVAGLPSETVRAPRNLSVSLQNRLFDISMRHDGTVPLHGRMFSEWMHRAYPNECPMPRAARSQPVEVEEADRRATQQEIDEIIRKFSSNRTDHNTTDFAAQEGEDEDEGDDLHMPWSETEELLTQQEWTDFEATEEEKAAVVAAALVARPSAVRSYLRPLAFAAVATSSAMYILTVTASLWSALLKSRPKSEAMLA